MSTGPRRPRARPGRTTRWARACTTRCVPGGTSRSRAAHPGRAGSLVDAYWLREGWRDTEQSDRWRQRAREMVEGYTARSIPTTPRSRSSARCRSAPRRSPSAAGSTGSTSGTAAGRRRLQTGRHLLTEDDGPRLAGARPLRPRHREHVAPRLPAGRAAPPAERAGARLGARCRRAGGARDHVRRRSRPASSPPGTRWRRSARGRGLPARPGRQCSWCDFRRHARRAGRPHRAASRGTPWVSSHDRARVGCAPRSRPVRMAP